jgi:predicted nucleic acid-binding protein
MIVTDVNIIAYFWLNGTHTAQARVVWTTDPDWAVPPLWRSEFRNILTGYLRKGLLSIDQVRQVMHAVEDTLGATEVNVDSDAVLELAAVSDCSAYDCEYAALAGALGTRLVTEDRRLLAAFPDRAVCMAEFVGNGS